MVFSDDVSSASAFPGSGHLGVGHMTSVSPQKGEMQPVRALLEALGVPGPGFMHQLTIVLGT